MLPLPLGCNFRAKLLLLLRAPTFAWRKNIIPRHARTTRTGYS